MKISRFIFPTYILLVFLVTPMLTLAYHLGTGSHGYVPSGGDVIFTSFLAGFTAKRLMRYYIR